MKVKKLSLFGIVLFLFSLSFAATSAIYLHHERSTQATVEADCQNRELCLDRTNLAPLGRFNDGTLWHGVTQEKPNVSLTGTLGVTGATTLSDNLTLSLISTGRVPFTTTSGLITSSTTLAYDGTTFATNNGTFSGNVGVGTASPNLISANRALTLSSPLSGEEFVSLELQGKRTTNANFANINFYNNGVRVGAISGGRDGANNSGNLTFSTTNAGVLADVISITKTGAATFVAQPIFSTLSTSLPVFSDGSKGLVSNAMTGTGNVVMSASPTLSGTVSAAALNTTGNVGIGTASPNLIGTSDRALTISSPQSVNEYVSLELQGKRTGGDANFAGINFYDVANRMAAISGGRSGADNSGIITFSTANAGVFTDVATIGKTGAAVFTSTVTADSLISAKFYEENTFTITLTGVNAVVTGTARYVRIGKQVTLRIPTLLGTSNSTSCTLTGLPASITPGATNMIYGGYYVLDNGVTIPVSGTTFAELVASSTTITLLKGSTTTGFTASGAKGIGELSGIGSDFTFTYTRQ